MADVLQVSDIYCNHPRLFQKIIVPVDPLRDSPEYIIKTLSEGFQRASLEAKEVGAGNADLNAVETAWRLHEQLGATKKIKRFWRGLLYSCYIIAAFLTTLIAVLFTILTAGHAEELQWPATALAMTASLCIAVLQLLGADAELNDIQSTQARIVFEIFRFRMVSIGNFWWLGLFEMDDLTFAFVQRISKYSLNAREVLQDAESGNLGTMAGGRGHDSRHNQKKGGSGGYKKRSKAGDTEQNGTLKVSTNTSTKMHAARARFSKAIKEVMNELGSSDLYSKENLAHKRKAVFYSKQPTGMEKNRAQFENYVVNQLCLTDASDACKEIAISGLITPEDYFQLRVLPLLEWLDSEEDRLRLLTRLLQIGSMLLSGAAVVVGSAGHVEYIAIIVAGASGFFQVLKVMDLERRFHITSGAARELRGLESTWRAWGDLDRQSPSAAVHLVRTCEQLALQYSTNSAIQVDKSEIDVDPIAPQQQQYFGPRGDVNV